MKKNTLGVTDLSRFKGVPLPNHGVVEMGGEVYTLTAYLPEMKRFAFANDKVMYTFSGSEKEFHKRYTCVILPDQNNMLTKWLRENTDLTDEELGPIA